MGFHREMTVFRFIPLATAAAVLPALAMAAPTVAPTPAGQAAQQQQAPKPITKAEFTANIDARFGAVDSNKDGSLSAAEIGAVQQKALQQAAATQQQRIEAEFKKLDTNKDNQLSIAEFRAAAPGVRASETPAQMLAQIDSNKDGKVSAAEYRALPMTNFERMDTNKDGIVTPQEVDAARRK